MSISIQRIKSIIIENYRGFGERQELVLAEPNHISFLVGPNNAGKSLISRLFSVFHVCTKKNMTSDKLKGLKYFNLDNFGDNDFYDFNTGNRVLIKFKVDFTDSDEEYSDMFLCLSIGKRFEDICCFIYLGDEQHDSHEINWTGTDCKYKENNTFIKKYRWTSTQCTHLKTELFFKMHQQTLLFDSIRSFDRVTDTNLFLSGASLLDWLKTTKNLGMIRRAKEQVSTWLERLNMDVPRAVRVDESGKQLLFTFQNHLELSSHEVGTGYTMLYILLMEIARNQKKLVIIDEVESHLQPGLVKVLCLSSRNTERHNISCPPIHRV